MHFIGHLGNRVLALVFFLALLVSAVHASSDAYCSVEIPKTHPGFTATLYQNGRTVGSIIWTGFGVQQNTPGWISFIAGVGNYYTFEVDFILYTTGPVFVIVRENSTGALLQSKTVNVKTTHEIDPLGLLLFSR